MYKLTLYFNIDIGCCIFTKFVQKYVYAKFKSDFIIKTLIKQFLKNSLKVNFIYIQLVNQYNKSKTVIF